LSKRAEEEELDRSETRTEQTAVGDASVKHPADTDLALYSAGDLSRWRRPVFRLHVSRCEQCSTRVNAFRMDRQRIRDFADEMPPGLNWERLATEMTANIRVGLAAGECVAPRVRRPGLSAGWRIATAAVAFSALLIGAWWLNVPEPRFSSLERAMKSIARGRNWPNVRDFGTPDRGPLVEATAAGIELRESGAALGVSSRKDARPVSVSLSVQGSARAHYIDAETGQVTITSVYAH
jgi:hypothetical protein